MAQPESKTTNASFQLEKVYLKDLSIEVPHGPAIFLEREQPQIDVKIRIEHSSLENDIHEVIARIVVVAAIGERVAFLVELAQAGIFQFKNVAEEQREMILMVPCANILFPYMRENISNAVTRAGFAPVYLSPFNFETLYRDHIANRYQERKNSSQSDAEAAKD